jgi:hypothetical protein
MAGEYGDDEAIAEQGSGEEIGVEAVTGTDAEAYRTLEDSFANALGNDAMYI